MVLDPFFPDMMLPCSQRNKTPKIGKTGQAKMEFICSIHGQGSKKKLIIVIVVVSIIGLLLLLCCGCCIWRQCRKAKGLSVGSEVDGDSESQHHMANVGNVAIDFES